MPKSIAVVFSKKPPKNIRRQFDEVIFALDLPKFVSPGSIQEAYELFSNLSGLDFPKVYYKGFDLWWMDCEAIYERFCLPYTQYRNLLEHLKDFNKAYFFEPPCPDLLKCFCKANNITCVISGKFKFRNLLPFPFGLSLQLFLSVLFLPWLKIGQGRNKAMIWTSDKFDPPRDHNFRVKFIYEELRKRKVPFVEFIRSMEKWPVVLQHAFIRKRPVFYSTAVIDFIYFLTSPFSKSNIDFKGADSENRFWLLAAAYYSNNIAGRILAIRAIQFVLKFCGVKVAYTSVGGSRNFHEIIACKLIGIKTIGIQHGIGPRHDFVPDFMPNFKGSKPISVDEYGLWSSWWQDYYEKYSQAYNKDQIFISGPMRPLGAEETRSPVGDRVSKASVSVLLMSEELVAPEELIPYYLAVLNEEGLKPYFKFRPYRDKFEFWLKENRPDVYKLILDKTKVFRGSMEEAVKECDVVVGSRSTAVLESLMQMKPFIFFRTQRCGDYFGIKEMGLDDFFAENPKGLIERIKNCRNIPAEDLLKLQKQFFGNTRQNGSAWVVDRIEKYLKI